jgi:hypothetical protein
MVPLRRTSGARWLMEGYFCCEAKPRVSSSRSIPQSDTLALKRCAVFCRDTLMPQAMHCNGPVDLSHVPHILAPAYNQLSKSHDASCTSVLYTGGKEQIPLLHSTE